MIGPINNGDSKISYGVAGEDARSSSSFYPLKYALDESGRDCLIANDVHNLQTVAYRQWFELENDLRELPAMLIYLLVNKFCLNGNCDDFIFHDWSHGARDGRRNISVISGSWPEEPKTSRRINQ